MQTPPPPKFIGIHNGTSAIKKVTGLYKTSLVKE